MIDDNTLTQERVQAYTDKGQTLPRNMKEYDFEADRLKTCRSNCRNDPNKYIHYYLLINPSSILLASETRKHNSNSDPHQFYISLHMFWP